MAQELLIIGDERAFRVTALTDTLELSVRLVIMGQLPGSIKPHTIAAIEPKKWILSPLPFVGSSTTQLRHSDEQGFEMLETGIMIPKSISLSNVISDETAIEICEVS